MHLILHTFVLPFCSESIFISAEMPGFNTSAQRLQMVRFMSGSLQWEKEIRMNEIREEKKIAEKGHHNVNLSLTIAKQISLILICTCCHSMRREHDFCRPFRKPLDIKNSCVRMHLFLDRIYLVSFSSTFSAHDVIVIRDTRNTRAKRTTFSVVFFVVVVGCCWNKCIFYSCRQNVWCDKNFEWLYTWNAFTFTLIHCVGWDCQFDVSQLTH